MRCPKCGYLTFDHLETCTKCRKKIAAKSEQLSGTVSKAKAPAFLQFKVHEPGVDNDASVDLFPENNDTDVEFSLDEEEVESDNVHASEEIEFDFMDESQDAPASQANEAEGGSEFDFMDESQDVPASQANETEGGSEFDLDLFDEESVELDLDEGDTDVVEGKDGPQLDFSELDISDLAPPVTDEDNLSSEELTLEDPASAPAAKARDSSQPSMGIGGELEDLLVEGLDLEMPSLPPAGNVTGKRMSPAVKTGTALDGFDVDVRELMSHQGK